MEGGIVGQAQEVVSSFNSFHTLNVFHLQTLFSVGERYGAGIPSYNPGGGRLSRSFQ